MPRPDLLELVERYIDTRDIVDNYAQGLRCKVRVFCEWAGSTAPSKVMKEEVLNKFLADLKTQRTPSTVKNYRGDLLVFWRWLADFDLVAYPKTRKVRKPHVALHIPETWTLDELRTLLQTSQELGGLMRHDVPRGLYWPACIRLAYEAGLRRSDCWRVSLGQIRDDGLFAFVSHKTGQRTLHALTPETVDALRAINRPLPLSWPYDQRNFGVQFDRIVRKAGIRRGTFKWLRRASGSYVEALRPGSGPAHLGHTSMSTFKKFYDARVVSEPGVLPQPPRL